MSQNATVSYPLWKRILFSNWLLSKSESKKIAYIAIFTALSIAANTLLEIKFFDVQFSLTIFISIFSGIMIGPLYGFIAAFLGDFVGYLINSWGYLYMPWVGISSALFALIAGLIMNGVHFKFKGGVYLKLALVCVITFVVCTAGVTSIGFYYYNKAMGFSTAVLNYFEAQFGGNATLFAYICYRLIFKLQILNSLVNYALIFAVVPILNSVKPLKIQIS